MLMGVPNAREAKYFKTILNNFMEALCMFINHIKSHIFLFNTLLIVQFLVSCILGFSRSSLLSKYMGVPLIISTTGNTP
jgi:hypothetical protein